MRFASTCSASKGRFGALGPVGSWERMAGRGAEAESYRNIKFRFHIMMVSIFALILKIQCSKGRASTPKA